MIVAAVIGAVAVYGLTIPRAHRATRTTELLHPPKRVWSVVSDFEAMPTWMPEVMRMERIGDMDGHRAFRETNRFGAVTYVLREETPHRRLVVEARVEGGGFGGIWSHELAASDRGTSLTVTEDGWIANPLYRVMARHVMGYDTTLRVYLDAVAQRLATLPRERAPR
jgi:uncharacterized protein YndB with AHSA1/START domain